MKNRKQFIFITLFLVTYYNGSTQERISFWNNIYVKAKYHYGFILSHTREIAYNVEDHVSGIEINISKPTFGGSYYEKIFFKPRIGAGYYMSTLGNDGVFGKVHAFFPYINIPFGDQSAKFHLHYKIAFGMAYLTKKFDLKENLWNTAIGSHGNIYFNFCLNGRFKLNKQNELFAGAGFTHFSNGNYKKPNLGLNIVAVSFGMNHLFNYKAISDTQLEAPDIPRGIEFLVIYSAGFRVHDIDDDNYYFASSLSTEAGKYFSWKRKAGLGIDVFYNQSLEPIYSEKQTGSISQIDLIRPGIHVFHDFLLNRLAITMQIGYYIYSPIPDQRIYDRIGLRYKINNHLMVNFAIKAHYADADFVEWGIGYYWNN